MLLLSHVIAELSVAAQPHGPGPAVVSGEFTPASTVAPRPKGPCSQLPAAITCDHRVSNTERSR